ncbi:MHC class I antigen, partial [Sigmodon hispidus]
EMSGCDVGPDGRLLRWYDQMAYDGKDFPTLNEDLSSWTAITSFVAQILPHKLMAHLKANSLELLQKYLEREKDKLLRS